MAAATPAGGAERQAALIAAMPAVFVLIWSTGFIVARLGMPHAGPMGFLAWRYALSILAFLVWIAWARAAWPRTRAQWGHLAVTGVLMHAGYLGGVWAAVKAGVGAGTSALIVGVQPLLTALWVSATGVEHRIAARQWIGLALGLAAHARAVVALGGDRRADARVLPRRRVGGGEGGHRRGHLGADRRLPAAADGVVGQCHRGRAPHRAAAVAGPRAGLGGPVAGGGAQTRCG